jgi:FHA domain
MTDNFNGIRRTGRPIRTRSRRRWAIALAVAAAWLADAVVSGSVISSSALFLALAALATIVALVLRSLGFGMDHPLLQPLTTRPWRDGRDVLQLALRNLRQVFIITPGGSLLAPSAVEVCMNPADVDSLADAIDLELVSAFAVEAYEAAVAASSARILRNVPVEVDVIEDPAVPLGRYRVRQRRQQPAAFASAGAAAPAASALGFRDGHTLQDRELVSTILAGQPQAFGPPQNPLLRLVTGRVVTETRMSGARAGRARGAELILPDELTVSRLHARFTCSDGQWLMTAAGRNGVVVNGTIRTGEHLIRDGDLIRWGRQPDAPTSRVEIR